MKKASEARNNNLMQRLVSALFVVALVFGTFALAGCTGSKEEQDNCYGEDVPVTNE